jgi:hypothetical protein
MIKLEHSLDSRATMGIVILTMLLLETFEGLKVDMKKQFVGVAALEGFKRFCFSSLKVTTICHFLNGDM